MSKYKSNFNYMLFILFYVLAGVGAFAQTVQKMGTNPMTITPATVLELESTDKGFLPPRMTTTQRNSIIAPVEGLVIYNTDTKCIDVYNATGATWKSNSGITADATISAKGVIQLAGDLSGTAAGPLIAANAVTAAKILDGTILTADLAASSVTFAKIQNLSASNLILGRSSPGAGVVEEITTTGSGHVVRATSPVLVSPALGTPSSGIATNITGLPLTIGVTGTLPVANGGTGSTSFTSNAVLLGDGTGSFLTVPAGTAGEVLISDGTTWSAKIIPKPTDNVGTFSQAGLIVYIAPGSGGTRGLVASSDGSLATVPWEYALNAVSNPTNYDSLGQAYTELRMPTIYELKNYVYRYSAILGLASAIVWSSENSTDPTLMNAYMNIATGIVYRRFSGTYAKNVIGIRAF